MSKIISVRSTQKREKMFKTQRKITIMMFLYIGICEYFYSWKKPFIYSSFACEAGFLITWLPFAAVTLYSAFLNPDHIPPVASTVAAIFAKSSTVWSTLFFIFFNKNIKTKAFMLLCFKSSKLNNNDLMYVYFEKQAQMPESTHNTVRRIKVTELWLNLFTQSTLFKLNWYMWKSVFSNNFACFFYFFTISKNVVLYL